MEVQGLSTSELEELMATKAPRHKLSLALVSTFSSLDKLNHSFFVNRGAKCSLTNPNTDTKHLTKLFSSYQDSSKQEKPVLVPTIVGLLQPLNTPEKLKEIVKTGGDLRFLLIIVAIDLMFSFQEREATLAVAHVIGCLSNQSRKVLAKWLGTMTKESLLKRVESLQTLLSIELLKLMPDQQSDYQVVQKTILNLCKTMQILFQSNNFVQRITNDNFLNTQITQHVDPMSQIKMSYRNKEGLNFTKFPFLLDLNYKSKLLQMEYKIQHMISMEKGIKNLNMGFLSDVDLSGNLTLDKILYLHFQVKRDNLLEDSITQLSKTKASLKKPLRIAFSGEAGIDQGGIKNEYFQLITKEILNPQLGMFLPKHNNRLYWFNGDSFEPPINFEFVGTLLGLSIYNSVILDLPFPRVVYKKLLAKDNQQFNTLEDLEEVEPDIKKGLESILKTENISTLEMSFQISTESFGEISLHELKPNGSQIPVTNENKQEYCRLYAHYLLNKHVEKQFNAFKKGFFRVVTGNMIKVFFPDQLEKVICGDPNLDFSALQKSTQYQGYTAESKIVKIFWEVVTEMSMQMKKAFLFFCTGSDRSPIKGLGSIGFKIQRQGPDTLNLPTAHTCNNVFMLPEYNSKQKLKEKLELAIKNNVGFGLI